MTVRPVSPDETVMYFNNKTENKLLELFEIAVAGRLEHFESYYHFRVMVPAGQSAKNYLEINY